MTEGCLESPKGDLDVKHDDKELVEPFKIHLGLNLKSADKIGLELEASMLFWSTCKPLFLEKRTHVRWADPQTLVQDGRAF